MRSAVNINVTNRVQNSALYEGTIHARGTMDNMLQAILEDTVNTTVSTLKDTINNTGTDPKDELNPDSSMQAQQSKN